MNTPKKGATVILNSDLLHYRDIFNHAQVEHGITTVQLKAGTHLTVDETYQNDGYPDAVECHTKNGSFYEIPVNQLSCATQEPTPHVE